MKYSQSPRRRSQSGAQRRKNAREWGDIHDRRDVTSHVRELDVQQDMRKQDGHQRDEGRYTTYDNYTNQKSGHEACCSITTPNEK